MAETEAPAAPTGRVRWRRVLLWLLVAGIAVIGLGHVLGGASSVTLAIGTGAGLLVLGFLWFFPRIMRQIGRAHV